MSNNDSFSPAKFERLSFSVVPHALLRYCIERETSRTGIVALVAGCTCIQSDGRLRRISRNDMMGMTGMNQRMVDAGKASLRATGLIEPCRLMKDGAMKPDVSYIGHIGQDRIAQDVWVAIPQRLESGDVDSSLSGM